MRNTLDDAMVDAVAESGGELNPQVVISYDAARNVFVAQLIDDGEAQDIVGEGSSTLEALTDLAAKEEELARA